MKITINIVYRRIPFWAKNIYGNLKKIAQFSEFSFGATAQLARLNGGFLIKNIIDNFFKKIDVSTFESRNCILFAAHDATIIAALTTLRIYEVNIFEFVQSECFKRLMITMILF